MNDLMAWCNKTVRKEYGSPPNPAEPEDAVSVVKLLTSLKVEHAH